MRWKISLLAAEGFLASATGWSCNPLVFFPACEGSTFKRPRARHQEQKKLAQQQQGQVVEFKGLRRRRRVLHTTMTAAAGGSGGGGDRDDRGDCPSKNYNKDAWQRRASRAMKYVSMPIVKMAGQPREQVNLVPRISGLAAAATHTFPTLHLLPGWAERDRDGEKMSVLLRTAQSAQGPKGTSVS